MLDSIALLLGSLAYCIFSMDLALSIVYRRLAQKKGAWALIVFTATSLALVFFSMLDSWSALSFTDAYQVLRYIWNILLVLDIVFLLSYVPYFTCWIIGHPWRNPYKTAFYIISACFLGLSIAELFTDSILLSRLGYILAFIDIGFCICVMLKNRHGIADRDVRHLIIATFIVGASLLPLIIAGLFSRFVRAISSQIFFLAYAIEILVYLFLGVARLIKEAKAAKAEAEERREEKVDLSEYHITEREMEVITLVGQGLTNKEIAANLSLSVNTVNNHMANIFSKTGVRSRVDLLNLIHKGIW